MFLSLDKALHTLDKALHFYSFIFSSGQWGVSRVFSKCKRFEAMMFSFSLSLCYVYERVISKD